MVLAALAAALASWPQPSAGGGATRSVKMLSGSRAMARFEALMMRGWGAKVSHTTLCAKSKKEMRYSMQDLNLRPSATSNDREVKPLFRKRMRYHCANRASCNVRNFMLQKVCLRQAGLALAFLVVGALSSVGWWVFRPRETNRSSLHTYRYG